MSVRRRISVSVWSDLVLTNSFSPFYLGWATLPYSTLIPLVEGAIRYYLAWLPLYFFSSKTVDH